jgi:uncharacterized membrane protein YjjP (DUF1212 family)
MSEAAAQPGAAPAAPAKPAPPDPGVLLEFMFRLGQAFLACGEQTAKVELLLRRTASAYGVRRSRVVAFPTAVFISLHDDAGERVTLAECEPQTMRLDQMADIFALGEAAQAGAVPPAEGLHRLTAILKQKARFGRPGVVLGHTILTMGVAMVLMPTLGNVAAAAALGLIIGAVKLFNRGRAMLAVPLPVIAAATVSSLVFLAVKQGLPVDPLHALIPPLVTFLPGGMLTLGMVELAYGDMVSGASRLVSGFVQLVLLAFGLAAGAVLVGYSSGDLVATAAQYVKLPWAAWGGVLVFALGVYLHFSAPRNSLQWIMLVVLLAIAAQRAAAEVFGSEISGFFGMLVATPLGYLIQLRFRGPPAIVTFLPSFWLMVPGALGLLSVTQMLSDRRAGLEGLVTVVFVITSVALGTLVGASAYKWLTERFGWWQLQIGRVGRYFQRTEKK